MFELIITLCIYTATGDAICHVPAVGVYANAEICKSDLVPAVNTAIRLAREKGIPLASARGECKPRGEKAAEL